MTGEQLHAVGADGARRAKLWLEATTRANVEWVNPDALAIRKLQFPWHDGSPFSFDIGGRLVGDPLGGEEFFAEVKKYADAGDQNGLYNEYLAKCYCAFRHRPDRCDNFMWITWSAFATRTWSELCTSQRVREAVISRSLKTLGVDNAAAPTTIDESMCDEVATRLWIIVLSEKQEKHLVLTPEHQKLIRGHVAEKAAMQ